MRLGVRRLIDGSGQLLQELAARGFAVLRAPDLTARAALERWAVAQELIGRRPARVDAARIAPVAGRSAFVESRGDAALHTDQGAGRLPAHLQAWFCIRPAEQGGESLILDVWPLLRRIEREDRELFAALFTCVRRLGFSVGPLSAPTVSLERGHLVVAHPPEPLPDDRVGRAFQRWVDAGDCERITLRAGDVLVAHNHRVLHGRSAFSGERELIRLSIWLCEPLPAPTGWVEQARAVAARLERLAALAPAGVGVGMARSAGGDDPEALRRLGLVLEELTLVRDSSTLRDFAARTGIGAGEVARWRERVLQAGARALAQAGVTRLAGESPPPPGATTRTP